MQSTSRFRQDAAGAAMATGTSHHMLIVHTFGEVDSEWASAQERPDRQHRAFPRSAPTYIVYTQAQRGYLSLISA